jgi:septal ring factor EnvC (AmiA/AmiB activator)
MGQILAGARLGVVGAGLLAVVGAHAAQVGTETELEGIKKKITREKQGLTRVEKKEESVLKNLQAVEGSLQKNTSELKKVNRKLEAVLGDVQKKEHEARQAQASLRERRELIKIRARALYKWQRSGSPFVLFNGDLSVAEILRRKRYLEVTLGYDRALVDSLRNEFAQLANLRIELSKKREAVDRERSNLVRAQEAVRSDREKKRHILASLRREKETRLRALKELEQAAARLEKMIDEIGRKTPLAPKGQLPSTAFEVLRGRLDLPVRGKIVAGFGKVQHPEFSAELFRKGIDIEAPLGDEIKAVAAGRVVFADRFTGYGNMIIVDHGERYFTVYAHLSSLLKKNGEPVRQGDPLGLVGDSDSLAGTRLYFEIRKDGRPVDPSPWFRK